MLDQGVKQAKDGQVHRFLGKDMPMPAGPAQLARAARAPVLPVATLAATPRWRFALQPPLTSGQDVARGRRRDAGQGDGADRARPAAALELAAAALAQVSLRGRAVSDAHGRSEGVARPAWRDRPQAEGAPVSAEPLWVLLGNRHGDNRQLLAIADALGRPYRTVQLRFGPGARLAPARWFAHRLTWRTDPPLAPPWPRAVLAAGRKSVPAALWIRRASGGRTTEVVMTDPARTRAPASRPRRPGSGRSCRAGGRRGPR